MLEKLKNVYYNKLSITQFDEFVDNVNELNENEKRELIIKFMNDSFEDDSEPTENEIRLVEVFRNYFVEIQDLMNADEETWEENFKKAKISNVRVFDILK